ncbi:MAG: glycosyltransferase family 2 protein [Bacteroidota bacterium]
MQQPLVSIITVVYNGAQLIAETLQSAIEQSYTNIELVVVDGGSTDGTLNAAKQFSSKISTIISEPDKGIYEAMNKGIKAAKGEWIYFLNVGDRFYDSHVLQDIFSKDLSQFDFVYAQVETINEPTGINYINGKPVNLSDFYTHYPICHQATFTRKNAFDKIGGYDISYKLAADTEWFVRFFKQCVNKAMFIPRIVSFYDVQGTSYHKRMAGYKEYIRFSAIHFPAWVSLRLRLMYPLIWLKVKFIRTFQETALFKQYRKIRFRGRVAKTS